MNTKKEKWNTWWWYHKTHVLIAVAVIALILYSVLPGLLTPKPDYSVAMITMDWVPEEIRAAVKEKIVSVADDRNHDGRVLLELNYYQADLSGETEGTDNYLEASKLDADLVGKVSSIFLLENPDDFLANTAVSIEEPFQCSKLTFFDGIPLPGEMAFTVRADSEAQELYQRVIESGRKESFPEAAEQLTIEDVVQKDTNSFSCTFDRVKHSFILDLPAENVGAPLVVMLPGYGNTAEAFRTSVHFEENANDLGYAVVYVTGAPDPNSPTSAVGWHSEVNTVGNRDTEFLVSLVKYLQKEYCLDTEHTYVVGFSNGGLMAHCLGMETNGVFAAVVSVAGWMPESVWNNRRESNQISVFQITGEKDNAVPKHSDGSAKYTKAPAIEDVTEYWAKSNGLREHEEYSVGKESVLSVYYEKGNSQQVWSLLVKDGRHSWPDERFSGINTNALILDFFEAQNEGVL